MQGHLAQQQKAMAEEKAYLKDIISRMDTQLKEQQRQLEKVIMRNDSNRTRSYTGTCCSSASTKNVILEISKHSLPNHFYLTPRDN